jgi:hypothetical protein
VRGLASDLTHSVRGRVGLGTSKKGGTTDEHPDTTGRPVVRALRGRAYVGSKGDSTIVVTQKGEAISAAYVGAADFETGPAHSTMTPRPLRHPASAFVSRMSEVQILSPRPDPGPRGLDRSGGVVTYDAAA